MSLSHNRKLGFTFVTPNNNLIQVLAILVGCLLIGRTQGTYILEYNGVNEFECFHESVERGDQIEFSYEVVEGSALEIDIIITNPKNEKIRQDFVKTNGHLKVTTMMKGDYHFCFTSGKNSSKASEITPKLIMFDLGVIDAARIARNVMSNATKDKDGALKKLDVNEIFNNEDIDDVEKTSAMIDYLLLSTTSCRHDVRYLVARDRIHKRLNESSNRQIVWWCGAEVMLIIAVTLSQIWYVKRFFETRMKI